MRMLLRCYQQVRDLDGKEAEKEDLGVDEEKRNYYYMGKRYSDPPAVTAITNLGSLQWPWRSLIAP